MPSYAEMQLRIADELARDDIGEIIRRAIGDAIRHYQSEFTFANRDLIPLVTAPLSSQVDLPANVVTVDQLLIRYSMMRVPLEEVTHEYMLAMDHNFPPTPGRPTHYSTFNNRVRLWPEPDAVYPLTAVARVEIPAPEDDGDGEAADSPSYFWMTTAEAAVRLWAKGVVKRDALENYPGAQQDFQASDIEFRVILVRTMEVALPEQVTGWDPY